jgi:hypothetical protein
MTGYHFCARREFLSSRRPDHFTPFPFRAVVVCGFFSLRIPRFVDIHGPINIHYIKWGDVYVLVAVNIKIMGWLVYSC